MITEDLIRQRFKQGAHYNFAACRLPNSDKVYFFYADRVAKLARLTYETEGLCDFVFSPYAAGCQAYIMQAGAVFVNDELLHGNISDLQPVIKSIAEPVNFEAHSEFYTTYVNAIVSYIENDGADKIVAARAVNQKLSDSFNHAHFFITLLQQYPHAMVYYVNHAEWGCWFGATPELLMHAAGNEIATMSLAGTMPADSKAAWGEKELQEQAMVTDFLEQIFEQYKLPVVFSENSEITSGAIKHLCTQLKVKTGSDKLVKLFHKILADINPTPAVCGFPQFDASVFIGKHEKLERRFYSGFLGIKQANSMDLYVNLRCMEVGTKSAILYAGAGITNYSSPTKEWNETNNKLKVLGSLINV